MSYREQLLDIIKQTSSLFESLKISGTDKSTKIEGCHDSGNLFVDATLKTIVPEFEGKFGLTNMKLLSGLLNFANYKSDDAEITVKRRIQKENNFVEQLELRNTVTGNYADFRMMDPNHIPNQAIIPTDIKWDITIVPEKSKIAEFQQIASLYAEIDENFGTRVVDDKLQFFIGDESSASHRTSMVFEENIIGSLKNGFTWNIAHFMSLMKFIGNYPMKLKITNRGVLLIEVETDYGTYNYYLRANR